MNKSVKILDIARMAVESACKNGADAADAVIFGSDDLSIKQRLGKPESIERAESRGLGLRVLIGEGKGYRQAMISTNDISESSIMEMVMKAVDMAKISPADPYIGIASQELLAGNIPDLELKDNYEPSADELKKWASEAEQAALSIKGVTNSDGAEASWGRDEVALVNSNGFAKSYESSSFSVSVSVIAGGGTAMETDYDYSAARHKSDLKNLYEIGRNAGERAIKRLKPRKVKTCQVPVVYEARVARSLMGSLASAINGAAIARGTSFLKNKMNKKILPDSINIIDNPLMKRGLGSEPFDGEGVAGRKLLMVENGILKHWLLDIRSANKLGLVTTGNASRGLSSPPSPSSSNFYMEAGKLSVRELISDIKSGLYVTDLFGMGVNIVTGDYSQGASGFWIENGEIQYPVNEITIAGNLEKMFLDLTPADDLEFLSSISSPTIRIEKMTVAGG